jgi:glycosyltransferase involved in cell wall biosynthesis
MNILHLTSTDLRGAGSCVAALNSLLNANGHHSRAVVVFKTKNDPNIIGFIRPLNKTLQSWIDDAILLFHKVLSYLKVGRRDPDYYFYNLDERKSNFSAKAILKKAGFKPDAIFIHWVSNFINTATIRELAELTKANMFWVMVDNAPITGGCHYPWQCRGYETDCSDCPALLTPSKKYIAQRNFALKKKNLPDNLQILTFSSVDKERAEKCDFYLNKRANLIFLPVNEQVFCPVPMAEARQSLNLPADKKIIFFAATYINERRKGYTELQDALAIFEKRLNAKGDNPDDYIILTAGKQMPEKQQTKNITGGGNSLLHSELSATQQDVLSNNLSTVYLGYISERDMVNAFNAATLFVCPTLEDSAPGILGQAMLCGTPTVAFATGAAVDMIRTSETGYLAKLGDSADLAEGIDYIFHLSAEHYDTMKANCRATGMATCSYKAVGEAVDKLI